MLYGHPTVKPQAIIEDLVLNSSEEGDVILDPFSGSGTTGAAAVKLHRSLGNLILVMHILYNVI